MQILPLLVVMIAFDFTAAAPAKELAAAEMVNVLQELAVAEQNNLKDLGRSMLTKTYSFLMDKLGPAASAQSWDCAGYALDALKSLTTAERKAIIEQCDYQTFNGIAQGLPTTGQHPMKDLGKNLLTTAYNFLMDKLGPAASIEEHFCNHYALSALKSLTKAERETAVQEAFYKAKAQARPGQVTQNEGFNAAIGQILGGFGNGYVGEQEAREQFMTSFLPMFTGLVTDMLNKQG